MSPKKTITEVLAKLVTYETSLPAQTILERMNKELGTSVAGTGQLMYLLQTAKSKDDLVNGVTHLLNGGGGDFVFTGVASHDTWLNAYAGEPDTVPAAYLYTIANPLVARGLFMRDLRSALHVPIRLLVLGNSDKSGTRIFYFLPSSIIPLEGDEEQRAAAEVFDSKLERLILTVMDTE